VPTTRSAALTTTVGMINRVHGDTANLGSSTEPTGTSRFAQLNIAMLFIANLANGRAAVQMNHTNFAGWKTYLAPFFVLTEQLSRYARCSTELGASPDFYLEGMDDCSDGNIPNW
jgi:hypothetical protein